MGLDCVRDKDGKWSGSKKLIWDDPRAAYIYSGGCAQRYTLPDGDILVPVTFAATMKAPRSVTTLRCGFERSESRPVDLSFLPSTPVKLRRKCQSSRRNVPLRPPLFSSRRMRSMVMARSTALHIS